MFVLFCDSDCDVTPEYAKEHNLHMISMPYTIGDEVTYPYRDSDYFNFKEFYGKLKKGVMPKTSALSPIDYINYFEPIFKEGKDILYVHFSKAMSGTFNAMNLAYEQLKEEYPERKLYTIDTKFITIGGLMIVKQVVNLVEQGKSIEEILKWAEEEVDHYAVYFYADDLKFFQRSGRISNFSAIMGGIIGIKPIIHMNSDGMMTSISKGRGKIPTLKKIVDFVEELALDIDKHPIIVGHSDALDTAVELAKLLKERFGNNLDIEFAEVNPTAGSHCGPNNVGVCFHSKHR